MGKKVIVFRNDRFLIDEIEDNEKIQDTVLSNPGHDSIRECRLKNTVIIKWIHPWDFRVKPYVIVTFSGEELSKIRQPEIEDVYSHIISFNDYTYDELNKLIENKKTIEISKINSEINELKNEKKFLLAEIASIKKLKKSINSMSLSANVFLENYKELKEDIDNLLAPISTK